MPQISTANINCGSCHLLNLPSRSTFVIISHIDERQFNFFRDNNVLHNNWFSQYVMSISFRLSQLFNIYFLNKHFQIKAINSFMRTQTLPRESNFLCILYILVNQWKTIKHSVWKFWVFTFSTCLKSLKKLKVFEIYSSIGNHCT